MTTLAPDQNFKFEVLNLMTTPHFPFVFKLIADLQYQCLP
jgi:hypothetical protein